jgi:hypothetical protein
MALPESQTNRDTTDDLSTDDLFHLLSNQRRRDTLRYLANRDGPVIMRDLAEWAAARECEKPVSQLRSKERQRVYIALYQSHLPKLDDNDIIEYNQSRGIVRRTALADQLTPYLDLKQEQDDEPTIESTPVSTNWTNQLPIHYALATGGIVLFISGWFELVSQFLLLTLALTALFVAVSVPIH